MVAAVSEKDNGIITPKNSIFRPKSRQVSSRYSSQTPSRRPPSPLVSRNSTTPAANRSVSADRRRPNGPDLTLKPNNAAKLLVTSSTRSLSVSFQGEAFSLPISKTKITPQNAIRKGTPERKRDHVENTKPMDHHRWPGRIRQENATVLSKRLSSDYGVEKGNTNCSRNVNVIRALNKSMNFDNKRVSNEFDLDFGNSIDVLDSFRQIPGGNSVKDSILMVSSSDHILSDTDSVSSGSNSGVQELENGGLTQSRTRSKGIIVSAKFWQETNSRMRRLQDPSSQLSNSPRSKLITPPRVSNSKKFLNDNSSFSSPRTMASPNRMRPSSPNKFVASPNKGSISPRRNSGSGISSNFSETPSVLSFAVDVRRGKVGENRVFDAHLLRILYNRQLQWRFVNARTEDLVLKQRYSAEENLWNAWIAISDLRDSVTKKRHRLQLLRQKLKLASILKAQIVFLEDWAYLDKDHSISLLGAIEALKATTLRLPVGVRATADLQSMKDAISSALDVMHAMGSSTNSLCLQVEKMNLMVTELAKVLAKERTLLRICKDFLSVLSSLKAKDCSLRTHMLQTSRMN